MHVAESVVPAGVWSADATHSSVGFEVTHMGVSAFAARFATIEAELTSGDTGVALRGTASADSIDIRDESLLAHVKAADFLDVERHPEITFSSTRFDVSGQELVIVGDLTIKGHTREVEARGTLTPVVSDPTGNVRIGLAARTTISRTDFGLDFQMAMPDGSPALGDEVTLVVSLELVKGQ
jgi:polyisoprenoid-binding protein YceI